MDFVFSSLGVIDFLVCNCVVVIFGDLVTVFGNMAVVFKEGGFLLLYIFFRGYFFGEMVVFFICFEF